MNWTTIPKSNFAASLPAVKAGSTAVHAARQLLDGLERILRASPERQVGWALLVLHLSRIPPPGARAHHRRVAAAVLDDAASRAGGQLFAMANGDYSLLFQPPGGGSALLDSLDRMFRTDIADVAGLCSLWLLPGEARPALHYVMERVGEGDRAPPPAEPTTRTDAVAAIDDIVQTGALSELMHRQTAVLLRPGRSVALVPLFREVAISTSVLDARIAGANAAADPFLFNHLAARLDRRMLVTLLNDVPGGGLLSLGLGTAALHINLTLAGILSQGFADFAASCPAAILAGLRVGVEVPFVEAFADIKAFIIARERLRLAKLDMVLDGLTHQSLMISNPGQLGASLVKLSWSPAMESAGPELAEALSRLGPDRVVLFKSENERAITWGLAHGITRFQGRYVDAMLAAERMRNCRHAARCNLRQCSDRAAATGRSGRAGCLNHPLLDLGAPIPATGRAPLDPPSPIHPSAMAA